MTPIGARERGARFAIRDELEADQQASAANLADVRVVGEALVQQGSEAVALPCACLDQALLLEDPEHLAGNGGADGMVRVREPVDEAGAVQDGVANGSGRRDEAEWEIARGRTLGTDEDVGPDAPVIDAEPRAGAPEGGHHLVGDQQDAVPLADLGDRGPVAIRGDGGRKRRADDRLGDERGDGAGTGRFEGALELGGQLVGVAEGIRAGLARAVRVRSGDVAEPAEPGLVRASQRLPAGQVQRAQGVAVVAPPPGE